LKERRHFGEQGVSGGIIIKWDVGGDVDKIKPALANAQKKDISFTFVFLN
jgi:hypothetical protein